MLGRNRRKTHGDFICLSYWRPIVRELTTVSKLVHVIMPGQDRKTHVIVLTRQDIPDDRQGKISICQEPV